MVDNLIVVVGRKTSGFDPKSMCIIGETPYDCLERVVRETTIREMCMVDFKTVNANPVQEHELLVVHSQEYIDFVKNARGWQSKNCGHVQSSDNYIYLDNLCFDASLQAASNALFGAGLLLNNDTRHIYALTRPPGHHAGKEETGGTCYFNNAALAAIKIRNENKKVAVLDIDRHAGNGTYDILLDRENVLFASIHVGNAYPWNPYYNASRNNCIAAPIDENATPNKYIEVLERTLGRIAAYGPDMLIVSVGTDTSRHDIYDLEETGTFGLDVGDFHRIGMLISSLHKPTLSIQEGGYNINYLAENVKSYLDGINIGGMYEQPDNKKL